MTFQPPGGEFLLFLVVAVILVPVQSGFEEVFLRGYHKYKWVKIGR